MSEPIKDFTTVVPFWQPRVAPVILENATDEQLAAMKVTVSNTKIGEYTLVLAQDPETLRQRTPPLFFFPSAAPFPLVCGSSTVALNSTEFWPFSEVSELGTHTHTHSSF